MKLKYLEIYNYGPFKDKQVIQFPDKDFSVYFIQGTYDGDSTKSNRAGKSSFVEAVRYLLFGDVKSSKVKEVDLIHTGQDEMYVYGIVEVKGQTIKLKRGRTRDNKAIFDLEGSKEILKGNKEAELQKLLGINCQDFTSTFCFKQDDIHAFMSLGPSDRKKTVINWFNFDQWKKYEDEAKKRLTVLETRLKEFNIKKDSLTAQIQSFQVHPSLKDKIAEYKVKLDDIDDKITDKKAELRGYTNLDGLKKKLVEVEDELRYATTDLLVTGGKISLLTSDIKTAIAKREEASKMVIDDPTEFEKKYNELNLQQGKITTQINHIVTTYQVKSNELTKSCSFGGICPVDRLPCDKGSRIPSYFEGLKKELETLSNDSAVANAELVKICKFCKDLSEHLIKIKADKKKYDELMKSDPKAYQEALEASQKYVDSLKKKVPLLDKEAHEIKEKLKEDKFSALSKELSDLEEFRKTYVLGVYEKLLHDDAVNEKNISYKAELIKQKETIELEYVQVQEKYYLYLYICSVLHKDGIPSLLIENSISEVEDFANVILDSVSPGFKLEFSTFKELSTKETHCSVCGTPYGSESVCLKCRLGRRKNKVKEEIDLKVFNNSLQEVQFDLDSGGGKVLVSLALRLALSKLLSKNFNTSGILILDEIFGSLDEPNRNLVARLLFNKLKDIMNVSQVFVITHCSLNESSYDKIAIKRFDGYSKIFLEN